MSWFCGLFSRNRRANQSLDVQQPGPRPYNARPGQRVHGLDTTLDEKKERHTRPAGSFPPDTHLLSPLSPEAKWNPHAQAAGSHVDRPYSKAKDEGVSDPEKQPGGSREAAARLKAAQEEQERLDFFQMM